jgi:nicotinate-nucleotide pyrophosphorylase (carboxylating)
MTQGLFEEFFTSKGMGYLDEAIDLALREDGSDLTSVGLFTPQEQIQARILAKEDFVVAGLTIASRILERCSDGGARFKSAVAEGETVLNGTVIARINGQARAVLKAERTMLNFLGHLCGIATLTRCYVNRLYGTKTQLLDTRKTLPGLRYPEKYAVRLGGGVNHRIDLEAMLMLKDNHIDRWGNIKGAVRRLRSVYIPCPAIEVECRDLEQVAEAVASGVDRIMLDNMRGEGLREALALIPDSIETEVSGNVTLDNIRSIAELGPDFISVGRLTHSAPSVDLSLQYDD